MAGCRRMATEMPLWTTSSLYFPSEAGYIRRGNADRVPCARSKVFLSLLIDAYLYLFPPARINTHHVRTSFTVSAYVPASKGTSRGTGVSLLAVRSCIGSLAGGGEYGSLRCRPYADRGRQSFRDG
ncbi:hypothetical protein BC834DRAFT_867655 [Gloeopeniophorella convolvens]|nr:hypothetical protein BC834DRAFT_867655 [Gloeopeniophorella convolvens]